MYPVLFQIGHFTISTYGAVVALAFVVAGWVAARRFRERELDGDAAWSLFVYALVGGFVGAKIYFVLLHGEHDATFFSRAGFVWYGGLIGGTLAVLYAVWRKRLPLAVTADAFAPSLALGHGIGHIACFFSGDSYGLPSNLPWAVAFPRGMPPSTADALRNEFGVAVPPEIPGDTLLTVHPTMLYSTLALLVIFAVLWALRERRAPAGWLFGLYLILTGIERFLVEFLRAKDDRFLWGFTTAQAIATLAIVGGTVLLITLYSRLKLSTSRAAAGAH